MRASHKSRKIPTVLILLLFLVISTIFDLNIAANPSEKVLFSDGFDNYTVGSFPSQWTLVFNGMGNQFQQVINDPLNSSNHCLQLQGERNWAADAVKYFQSNSDIVGFEASVLVTANNGTSGDDVKLGLWKQVNWGQAKWTDGVVFTDTGNIVARANVDAEGSGTFLQKYVPGQWYHIRFILDRLNKIFSVYVDGSFKGEFNGSDSPYDFDGLALSGRYTEIPVNYDNIKIFESPATLRQEPSLAIYCISSTTMSNFKVEIKGNLTFNGTGLPDEPILLSYSVTGGNSWIDLTLVQTNEVGSYHAEWMTTVTGCYEVKAVYNGNEDYSDARAIANFAVEPLQEQTVLSLYSNSTLSEFSFNSTSRELSFSVSGDSGTTGYVTVNIPKSLSSDISTLKVFLDNTQVAYSFQSNDESWLLYITYHHSTHLIGISLGSSITPIPTQVLTFNWVELSILAFMGILAVVSVVLVFAFLKKKKINEKRGYLL